MKQVYVDCSCGYPVVITGVDPDALEVVRSSSGKEQCPNCNTAMGRENAYIGRKIYLGDGKWEVQRVAPALFNVK